MMFVNRPIHSFQEAERLAKRRLPKAMYDAIACGAGQEITLRDNLQAFQEVGFRPRAAVQHSSYDLHTSVLGHEISLPVMIAPTGSMRMFHTSAEPAVTKAAGRAGTLQVVSCFMGYPVDEVVEAAQGPVFFDLYFAGGRDNVEVMLNRARKAGCQALVITVDMTGGHASERAGRATPLVGSNWRTAVRFAPQLLTKPAWTFDFIRDGMRLDCPMWIKPNGRAASFGEMSTSILREWPT
jgi:pre-mycofactocin synthase